MTVTFACFGDHLASARLRARIPQAEVAKLGMFKGMDIVVYGKHWLSLADVSPFRKRVFDVCDDHFASPYADYYREHIAEAHLVTCNSGEMARIIERETNVQATVIPDPYESDEKPAGMGNGLLWFGHQSNLPDLHPYLDMNPEVLTGTEWSREKQLAALDKCAAVLIPTGKSMAKSANRLIESVRNGRFVIAGNLPAHDEFKEWMWVGDIRDGVEWLKEYPKQAVRDVAECQRYIRDKYSPAAIGRLWFNALVQL